MGVNLAHWVCMNFNSDKQGESEKIGTFIIQITG
jgi:hypothetical protein